MSKPSKASETDNRAVDTTETVSQCPIKKQRRLKEVSSSKITGSLPWHTNKQANIWDLIYLIGQDEYFKGLFGKKDTNKIYSYLVTITLSYVWYGLEHIQ